METKVKITTQSGYGPSHCMKCNKFFTEENVLIAEYKDCKCHSGKVGFNLLWELRRRQD